MRLFLRALSVAAAGALSALPAFAAPWVLDKSHAHVSFSVGHLGFSTTRGQFRAFDATIDFDPDNPANSSVRFVIEAASIDTGHAPRDEHLRSGDFLDTDHWPEIVFQSTHVEMLSGDRARILGELTLRGQTRTVAFLARIVKIGPHPFNRKQRAGFSVSGEIDRTQFGIDYGAPLVDAAIPLQIDLEITPR